ncbi:3'-5' exonuclease [Hymenobacter jeollabukensis]|uniref:3'-5' exonuclease n=1 Tax=Hymenobacter jeollabukensis TaxID=2025313 RepID=UPI001485078C|nr:3'-5' exonuclease [Hymenobacter jeollabukensis]
MTQYLLFVDTETTGLPRRWDQPYASGQWPHVAQLAWQIYTAAGELVKEENHFLQIPAGSMPAAAVAVHGITPAFLHQHGQPPGPVLQRLLADLAQYQPRVIGYFLQLDFHVIGAALHRAGLPNPLPALPQFCTMKVSGRPDDGTHRRYRRLAELHELLLGQALPRLHDAREDAAATARCFFELRRLGRIPPDVLSGQPPLQPPTGRPAAVWPPRSLLLVGGALLLVLLLLALLWTLV